MKLEKEEVHSTFACLHCPRNVDGHDMGSHVQGMLAQTLVRFRNVQLISREGGHTNAPSTLEIDECEFLMYALILVTARLFKEALSLP